MSDSKKSKKFSSVNKIQIKGLQEWLDNSAGQYTGVDRSMLFTNSDTEHSRKEIQAEEHYEKH